jgi:hypothetical protein
MFFGPLFDRESGPARRKIPLNRFAIKALTMRILRNRRQSRIAAKKWETTDYADEQAAS